MLNVFLNQLSLYLIFTNHNNFYTTLVQDTELHSIIYNQPQMITSHWKVKGSPEYGVMCVTENNRKAPVQLAPGGGLKARKGGGGRGRNPV